jgi:hypothetical protein
MVVRFAPGEEGRGEETHADVEADVVASDFGGEVRGHFCE